MVVGSVDEWGARSRFTQGGLLTTTAVGENVRCPSITLENQWEMEPDGTYLGEQPDSFQSFDNYRPNIPILYGI